MSLAPYTITALARNDIIDTPTNKNVVSGAVVTAKDINGATATMYDTAAGGNGSTSKTTGISGTVTVYVAPGEYTFTVNGIEHKTTISPIRPIRSVPNFASIATFRGGYEGEPVQLVEYNAGTGKGGGFLTYTSATKTPDNGVIFACANGWLVRRLEGFVTPEMFGAAGDGVTDDTARLQACVNSGYRVSLGVAVYIVSGAGVSMPDGLTITGHGVLKTKLKKAASDGATNLDPILRERSVASVFQPVRNIHISGIDFEGNGDPAIKGNKGAGLLRFYSCFGVTVKDCDFHHSRGYGVGLQGAASSTETGKQGPNEDAIFENCNFYSNGKQDYLTGNDTDDGIDCKASDRITLIRCRAWDNGDSGFDIRARRGVLVACYSSNNQSAGYKAGIEGVQVGVTSIAPASTKFIACHAADNGGNGFAISPQVTPGVLDGENTVILNSCFARGNSHNVAVISQGTNDLGSVRLEINAMHSETPLTGTRHLICSAPTKIVKVIGGTFKGGNTTALSVNTNDAGHFQVTGASIEDITGSAIVSAGVGATDARLTVTGCSFKNVTVFAVSGGNNCVVGDNNYENVAGSGILSFSGTNNRVSGKSVGSRSVTAAASITLPEITDIFAIAGSTTITSITASWAGRVVNLRFTASCTVVDGSNLLLNGNLNAVNNTMLSLVCVGTSWYELARSVN